MKAAIYSHQAANLRVNGIPEGSNPVGDARKGGIALLGHCGLKTKTVRQILLSAWLRAA
jgi:hypothetical protein